VDGLSHTHGKPENVAEDKVTRENIRAVARIEQEARSHRSASEVVSGKIADFCGSMTFVWVHAIWFGGWIVINTRPRWAFDPFPFTFLTLVVSLEAIFLSTFILINQNRETAVAERRNHLDLQVNLLAEQENTRMLHFLEQIAKKVGAKIDEPGEGEDLKAETQPKKIMEQLAMEDAAGGET
jgi:uncharacterized membrane protein